MVLKTKVMKQRYEEYLKKQNYFLTKTTPALSLAEYSIAALVEGDQLMSLTTISAHELMDARFKN